LLTLRPSHKKANFRRPVPPSLAGPNSSGAGSPSERTTTEPGSRTFLSSVQTQNPPSRLLDLYPFSSFLPVPSPISPSAPSPSLPFSTSSSSSLSLALWIGSRTAKTVRSLEDRRREVEGPPPPFLRRSHEGGRSGMLLERCYSEWTRSAMGIWRRTN